MDIHKYKLPPVYKRQGQECYLDPIREKLIFITPEETVRQKVVSYLKRRCCIPTKFINVEEHLGHYGIKTKLRADIVITHLESDDLYYPIAVIECKAPSVPLGDKEREQAFDYANRLNCNYVMLTNGDETYCYWYDSKENNYISINELPKYDDMLESKYVETEIEKLPPRIPFDRLKNDYVNYIDDSIGSRTEEKKAIPLVNFLECLLDHKHKMPMRKYKIFRLIEDYGIRLLTYGNASGGQFFGPYRSFLVEYNGSTEFVSINISIYYTWAHPEEGKTAINVAIDSEETMHHSLQLTVEKNMIVNGDNCRFLHNGSITVGKYGAAKIDGLRKFVSQKYPVIIDGEKFNLGSLTHNRLWQLDDDEVIIFVENLIAYALVRDEYRAQVKKEKQNDL